MESLKKPHICLENSRLLADPLLVRGWCQSVLLPDPVFVALLPRIAMETYIRQRQLIMSPLITSHVIGENEPLTSVFNKVIAAKEVNHKGQGATRAGEGSLLSRGVNAW